MFGDILGEVNSNQTQRKHTNLYSLLSQIIFFKLQFLFHNYDNPTFSSVVIDEEVTNFTNSTSQTIAFYHATCTLEWSLRKSLQVVPYLGVVTIHGKRQHLILATFNTLVLRVCSSSDSFDMILDLVVWDRQLIFCRDSLMYVTDGGGVARTVRVPFCVPRTVHNPPV